MQNFHSELFKGIMLEGLSLKLHYMYFFRILFVRKKLQRNVKLEHLLIHVPCNFFSVQLETWKRCQKRNSLKMFFSVIFYQIQNSKCSFYILYLSNYKWIGDQNKLQCLPSICNGLKYVMFFKTHKRKRKKN